MAKRSRKQKKRRMKAYILRVLFALGIITVVALILFGAIKLIGTFTGGRGTTDKNTIAISSKGSIEGTIIDTFDKEYYSADELRSMAEGEISEYARVAGSEKSVILEDFDEKDGIVSLVLQYESASDYRSFNGKQLYVGTVEELSNAGIDFNLVLMSAEEEGTQLPAGQILTEGSYHCVVLTENLVVRVPKKILYTSENVTLVNSKTAEVTGDDETISYIIYK